MSASPFDIPNWYEDEDRTPINSDILINPPSTHQQLIPQIWADLIEKSLRRSLDLVGQELLDASFSQVIHR